MKLNFRVMVLVFAGIATGYTLAWQSDIASKSAHAQARKPAESGVRYIPRKFTPGAYVSVPNAMVAFGDAAPAQVQTVTVAQVAASSGGAAIEAAQAAVKADMDKLHADQRTLADLQHQATAEDAILAKILKKTGPGIINGINHRLEGDRVIREPARDIGSVPVTIATDASGEVTVTLTQDQPQPVPQPVPQPQPTPEPAPQPTPQPQPTPDPTPQPAPVPAVDPAPVPAPVDAAPQVQPRLRANAAPPYNPVRPATPSPAP